MGKTVFFNIPATGHINGSLPVFAELVRRGEEVIYVNAEEERTRVESTGARFVPYPKLSEMERLIKEGTSDGNIPRNMRDLVRISNDLYPFALEVIQREKPDYLIHDTLASWAKLAAKKSGLRTVSFVATFALNTKSMPPMKPAAMLTTMGQMAQIMPSYMGDAMRFRQEHGIFPVFLMEAVMALGDLNIVFTSREFQPAAHTFGDNFKFVGVTLTPRPLDTDFPFDQLHDTKKVYISLGTLARNDEFLRKCFEAFKDEPYQFILSAGKKTDLASLEPIPDNFIVRNFVPQLDILQRVDAFITHGGINSVQESLIYGVPLVVVPQQVEQAVVALQIEKHKAGIALQVQPPYGQVSADGLRNAIRTVLSSSEYAENAKKLGQTLIDAGGVNRAVDEVLHFARSS
jgi:MGT family glycosyltransferase